MKAAVISDIHCNCFALKAVLQEIEAAGAEHIFILGDIFGYYPWAIETYTLLEQLKIPKSIIKGNHDELILQRNKDSSCFVNPDYERAISENLSDLKKNGLLEWLNGLPENLEIKYNGKNFSLFHGTPDNPLKGRFYPDNTNTYPWFPKTENDVLLLGHTHYPMIKEVPAGGVILNPGSAGQPRDGNVQSSWMMIDNSDYSLQRTPYDIQHAVSLLTEMNWNKKAILALQKNYTGKLI